MNKAFEGIISKLSEKTGYDYNFLVDRYFDSIERGMDAEDFMVITMERDWESWM